MYDVNFDKFLVLSLSFKSTCTFVVGFVVVVQKHLCLFLKSTCAFFLKHLYDAGVFLVRRLSTEPQSGCAMLLYLFVFVFLAIYNNDDNRDTDDDNNNNNNNKKQDLTIHRSAVSRTSAHLQ